MTFRPTIPPRPFQKQVGSIRTVLVQMVYDAWSDQADLDALTRVFPVVADEQRWWTVIQTAHVLTFSCNLTPAQAMGWLPVLMLPLDNTDTFVLPVQDREFFDNDGSGQIVAASRIVADYTRAAAGDASTARLAFRAGMPVQELAAHSAAGGVDLNALRTLSALR